MVEAKGPKRRRAENGLAIRAAMMGADAVIDLNAERLPGFIRTEHRSSGTAVRAVDDEGRLELKSRWFDNQITRIRIPMLIMAFLFGGISEYVTCDGNAECAASATRSFRGQPGTSRACFAWLVIASLTLGMSVLRWPQLVRPTAICFLAKAVQNGLSIAGSLAGIVFMILGDASAGLASMVEQTTAAFRPSDPSDASQYLFSSRFSSFTSTSAVGPGESTRNFVASRPSSFNPRRFPGCAERSAPGVVAGDRLRPEVMGWEAGVVAQQVVDQAGSAPQDLGRPIDKARGGTSAEHERTRMATGDRSRPSKTLSSTSTRECAAGRRLRTRQSEVPDHARGRAVSQAGDYSRRDATSRTASGSADSAPARRSSWPWQTPSSVSSIKPKSCTTRPTDGCATITATTAS